jgi:hypothetical protein
MTHKLGICIPYRNREEHLNKLVSTLGPFLEKKGIDYGFYVGHQVDDKLFNRGAMKNIAAIEAFKDGCDYIAWHDVDMLPEGDDCDYSYPETNPIHIATKLSKYSYSMGYEQYFGGVVLFNKEQVQRTNGYSNDYWDWGQEDDDLLWRCKFEGYVNERTSHQYENKRVGKFNGVDSSIRTPMNREINSCLHNDHTISILVKSEQQTKKVPIWLVGDEKRQFIEYPILRKENSWTWGLSFNNSRAYSSLYHDRGSNPLYHWMKRSEDEWSWVTTSYDSDKKELYMFMNNQMVSNDGDILTNKPIRLDGRLKSHTSTSPFILGSCQHTGNNFKGEIGGFRVYDRYFDNFEECYENTDDLIYEYTFEDNDGVDIKNVEFENKDIKVNLTMLPHRRDGSFYCLPHTDEGFVNGKWAKGESTARNEKRFVTEMQQNKIDYKSDGINNIKYETVEVINHSEKCKLYNVKL